MEAGQLTITVDELYTRIGKLEIERQLLRDQITAHQAAVQEYKELLSRTSKVAGEAIRALETFGHEEVADAIHKGNPWQAEGADSEAAEGGSQQVGPVAEPGLGEDSGGEL